VRKRFLLWSATHPSQRKFVSVLISGLGLTLAFLGNWNDWLVALWAFFLGLDTSDWMRART
jgi:hypothetical protein